MKKLGSIRWNVMRVVLVTTLSALLINAVALIWLDMPLMKPFGAPQLLAMLAELAVEQ